MKKVAHHVLIVYNLCTRCAYRKSPKISYTKPYVYYLSTKKEKEKTNPWFSKAETHERRKKDSFPEAGKGAETTRRVVEKYVSA
ncbi:MAG: hypothetical protein A3G60_00250 [Candidatus Ryanbacteria bacterium RIFCSPLOWO2_12_FULL_47_9c]|uniref:Uncharacterized protein n=2 Tax=Candidatus Ryaniibacteriota TaxID=1817914 RepID=A0A1G2H1S4_9BACT|nr:MAG: hypothetical protein A3C83_02525 [Candidatus Ryanbacteria bacterium RIFCSPHIGHO2_02_FULL_47_25]OGZ52655.1 MAG: hypothetical protein A3A29_00210 [Candidatus Ryanbacteria bacterium RIFCSPLOWO2_01_FULL_47_79]OGZ56403.1 MAG: hypothetical protein A3G60_00250 [Candidatus Ryanbacteria bacterium RIFCSPLOWO2_12_FULL_47_9c]OGZ56998.1 MAG: hypothetical protein A3J04_01095 [Candidatus Ryanbacteria bacterium RIFCSPLOWO2_02_FULL_47_14]